MANYKKRSINSNDQMLDRYIKALKDLKTECDREIPIKTSHFAKDHKIHSLFFKFLYELNVVESVVKGTMREGAIFSWIYRKADNEAENILAMCLLSLVRDYDAKASEDRRKRNMNPKYLKKQFKKDKLKESLKTKEIPNVVYQTTNDEEVRAYKNNNGVILLNADERIGNQLSFLLKTYEERLEIQKRVLEQTQQDYDDLNIFVESLRKQSEKIKR